MTAPERLIFTALGAASIFFHIGLIFSGLVPNLVARPLHLMLALPWIFLLRAGSRSTLMSGVILCVAGELACLYVVLNEVQLSDQYGSLEGNGQLLLAITLLAVVLEMARRAIGWPLPMVALVAIVYGLFGQYLPGEFGYPGMPIESFLGTLTIAEGGIWGSLTGISVNVVAVFVIMGAVLNAGEAGQGFMNLASAAAGHLRGGAAKVSVLSSAFFGSISGSASANVASTGAITLPAMRRLGYPPALAGAVEAVASSGGQILPPLMGAGAFVMVELTGIPYTAIILAALFPAILYFVAVWIGINAFASRYDLAGLAPDDCPTTRDVVVTVLFFAVPFAVLLERMFLGGFTPQYAASVAILISFVMLLIDARLTLSVTRTRSRIEAVCVNAGKQISMIAAIIVCASIVIGVLGQTGLGVKITSLILSVSGDMLWPALMLTAIACLILGMEVPTTAAYVICISVAGPALHQLGLPPLQAHLFVFWFALLSTITPPVCGAVFIAAGMVEENWLRVAGYAMMLGVGLYLVPLGMIVNPSLIDLAEAPLQASWALVKIGAGLGAISFGIISPRHVWVRIGLVIIGTVLIFAPLP
ncbi:MAG: TRAP transporter permease DctM/Q [Rhodospirillaceae bacterium]|nr:TRAP transporter permease DctM/Q [Rhodospirillaceae bacterium]